MEDPQELDSDRHHRQSLGETTAAELLGQEADHQHGQRAGDRRKQAEREERLAEQGSLRRQQDDRERRVIDVAEGESLAASDVVELVPEEPIASPGRKGHGKFVNALGPR